MTTQRRSTAHFLGRALDPDGKVKWYPAIYSSKEFKGGHGDDVSVRMTYGDPKDLIWKALPDGTFKPFFREGTWRIKNFNVKQQDLDAKNQEPQVPTGERPPSRFLHVGPGRL